MNEVSKLTDFCRSAFVIHPVKPTEQSFWSSFFLMTLSSISHIWANPREAAESLNQCLEKILVNELKFTLNKIEVLSMSGKSDSGFDVPAIQRFGTYI